VKDKPKILNSNYVYGGDGRLVKFPYPSDDPWHVFAIGKIRAFRTHAKAIKYADKLARKGRK